MDNNAEKRSTHWTGVWDGLFTDPRGKHHKRMGKAIWVFLYILSKSGNGGKTELKYGKISEAIGIPLSTVKRYVSILKSNEYIVTRSDGRKLIIEVKKWRSLSNGSKEKFSVQQINAGRRNLAEKFGSPDTYKNIPSFERPDQFRNIR